MGQGRRALYLLTAGFLALWVVARAQAQVPTLPPGVETTSHILVSRASVDLMQPWLAPGEGLTLDSLTRLLNVAHLDPVLDAQVTGLLDSLGLTAETLLPLLRVCETMSHTGTGEFIEPTLHHGIGVTDPLAPAGSQPLYAPALVATLQNPSVRATETRHGALGVVTAAEDIGSICIVRNAVDTTGRLRPLTLLESFITFMHELTHMAHTQRYLQAYLTSYDSYEAWLEAELMRPGGEWESYVAEGAAAVRLLRQLPPGSRRYTPALARYFDAEGNLTDAPGLRRFILAPLTDGGLGYGPHFEEVLQNQATDSAGFTRSDIANFDRFAEAYGGNAAELLRVETYYRDYARDIARAFGSRGDAVVADALAHAEENRRLRLQTEALVAEIATHRAEAVERRCSLWRSYHGFFEARHMAWPDAEAPVACAESATAAPAVSAVTSSAD